MVHGRLTGHQAKYECRWNIYVLGYVVFMSASGAYHVVELYRPHVPRYLGIGWYNVSSPACRRGLLSQIGASGTGS
jgi:hypothetical protein